MREREQTADDEQSLSFAELARRGLSTGVAPPLSNPVGLPLHDLEPAVLERLAAELVYRNDHHSVQFYGRSGQAQYGLDIVEHRANDGYTLYQVKRYQELTPAKLREAVTAYTGPPRQPDSGLPPRRFGADRFVVVTSAAFDSDTANVDALEELRREYAGDLQLEVWGSEALNRRLRDVPRVVYAVFGPAWAKEFCAFEPSPQEATRPRPLGLVEDPAEVLGLAAVLAEAEAAEASRAAVLHRTVADGLAEGGFPGHAAISRVREAEALLAAGEPKRALEALWPAAVHTVEHGEPLYGSRMEALRAAAAADPVAAARVRLLKHAEDWKEHGTDLAIATEGLEALAAAHDAELALLACMTLERALADGLFDFDPPESVFVETDATTTNLLDSVVAAAETAASQAASMTLRARLRCALADAGLRAAAPPSEVEAAYGPLLAAATAGRYGDAHSLIASRAGRAFALRGAPLRAEDLWRQAVLAASEAGFYGDARGALRAMTLLYAETGVLHLRGLSQVIEAMPDRRRLIGGGADALLYALAQAHAGKLPDALGHTRHVLLVAQTSGDLSEETRALGLLGDVLDAAGHPSEAVEYWVAAGDSEKAVSRAAELAAPAGVRHWLTLPWRRRADAAAQVLEAQAALIPDSDAPAVAEALLTVASAVWTAPHISPLPELSALKALAGYSQRLPAGGVAALLDLVEPALAAPTRISHDIVPVLAQVHLDQPQDRAVTGPALARILDQPDPPYNVWDVARQLAGAHDELLPTVRGEAEQGSAEALMTLAHWGEADERVQLVARRACSALLRRPVVGLPDQGSVTTQDRDTIQLLVALRGTAALHQFPAAAFSASKAWTAGGVIMSVGVIAGDEGPVEDAASAAQAAMDAAAPVPPSPGDAVDPIAEVCAGPLAALTEAIAAHLLKAAEDRVGLALVRVQPVVALTDLLDHVAPETAASMAPRLLKLHQDPGLTETDLNDIRRNVPLSRFRFGGGGADLAPAALCAAALAVRRGLAAASSGDELRATAADIVAAAIPLLRSDREARWAAFAVRAVATAEAGQGRAALLLTTHDSEKVRQVGALAVPSSSGLLPVLARDPSAAVRSAVASRAGELEDAAVAALRSDPHRDVRRAAQRADSAVSPP